MFLIKWQNFKIHFLANSKFEIQAGQILKIQYLANLMFGRTNLEHQYLADQNFIFGRSNLEIQNLENSIFGRSIVENSI